MMIRLNNPTRIARLGGRSIAAAVLVWLGTWTAPAFSEDIEEEIDGRYTYIRALDGEAELTNRDGDEETDAITNYPVLTGDRIETDDDTFVDVILSDGTQLTLGEDVELLFENLSGSPDGLSDDEGTLLQLLEGEALLRVGLVRTSAYYPVIDTANARIYIQDDGVYRIVANDHDFTEVAVLEGSAEVLTQTDDVVLISGEAASFDGYADPYVARLRADWDEEIVHWSENIERRYSRGSSSVLDAPLSGTAHLDDSGDWVTVDTGRAWRPRVEATWRPYHRGRWAHTPSGLYWVSYDPWLPVTYRYGLWDLHPSHGWLWYPGYRYRTAHVYWYWGTDYAGWIPSGYYNRYYRHRYAGFGFRAGVLGWAGSRWDPFYDWTFCPTRYIGYRNSYRHYERGRHLHDRGVRLGRGIIATSTRGLGRDDWKRPALVSAALERGWRRDERNRDLPDVTNLVSRGDLTPEVRDTFVVERKRRSDSLGGTRVDSNRNGRVATTIRDDGSAPSASSRGAVSTRSREAGRDGRVVRRSSIPSSASSGASSRGAVRRSDTPSAGTRSRSGATSARGAVPRDRGSVSRSSSPARRVIDGAGSRGSSTRSSTPSRRAPTASGSSGTSTRSRTATPTRRPPAARSSSGSSTSRSRASTPPPRAPSSTRSSSGRSSSTRKSTPPPSTRRSTPPSRSRASSPPTRRSSSSSSARRSSPPPKRSSASSSSKSRRPPSASVRSNPSVSRSQPSRSSTASRASSGRVSTRPSSRPSVAPRSTARSSAPSRSSTSRSRATAAPSRPTVQRSRASSSSARASSATTSRRSSASTARRSSAPKASSSPSRSSNRSSARSSSSRSSSSRSSATRSSARRKPPAL